MSGFPRCLNIGRLQHGSKICICHGGVVSGLGKGDHGRFSGPAAEKAGGLTVSGQEVDDLSQRRSGTMNPIQQAKYSSPKMGRKRISDLGHYERFIDVSLNQNKVL